MSTNLHRRIIPDVPAQSRLFWKYFDLRQTTEAAGDYRILVNNLVNLTIPAGSTKREMLERIALGASRPFAIDSVSELPDGERLIRGCVISGHAGDEIDKIVHRYLGQCWWMSKNGLVVGVAPSEIGPLSKFDGLAGNLMSERSIGGKLSKEALAEIAAAVDAAGFALRKELQPAQWKLIAKHRPPREKDWSRRSEPDCSTREGW
jgi:hypothetical protein